MCFKSPIAPEAVPLILDRGYVSGDVFSVRRLQRLPNSLLKVTTRGEPAVLRASRSSGKFIAHERKRVQDSDDGDAPLSLHCEGRGVDKDDFLRAIQEVLNKTPPPPPHPYRMNMVCPNFYT